MLDPHLRMDMCRYTFNTVGGLRLKRDLTEYAGAINSFGLSDAGLAAQFDTLSTLANLFIVVPDRCSLRLYPPNMQQLRESPPGLTFRWSLVRLVGAGVQSAVVGGRRLATSWAGGGAQVCGASQRLLHSRPSTNLRQAASLL
jgi:hypothetical protein